jgi:hypothetical protein
MRRAFANFPHTCLGGNKPAVFRPFKSFQKGKTYEEVAEKPVRFADHLELEADRCRGRIY